jgi:hypothetical protein
MQQLAAQPKPTPFQTASRAVCISVGSGGTVEG